MERHVHRAAPRDPSGGQAGVTLRVYGRTEYAEPLVEVGAVDDGSDVRAAFEGSWVAFADEAIHWIIRDGEEVDDDRALA